MGQCFVSLGINFSPFLKAGNLTCACTRACVRPERENIFLVINIE